MPLPIMIPAGSNWATADDVVWALTMRANFIETGNVTLSAKDVEAMPEAAFKPGIGRVERPKIRVLDVHQHELVARLRRTAEFISDPKHIKSQRTGRSD